MKKLILRMTVSLDGFMAGPKGELAHIFPATDEEAKRWISDHMWQGGVHIMGSHTYADMAAYWPNSNDLLAACMNEIPKVVFSRTGKAPTPSTSTRGLTDAKRAMPIEEKQLKFWPEPRVASGDLAQEVERLKSEPGKDIIAHGGIAFARSLVKSGLIDEYWLIVCPVALGRGEGLFTDLPKPQAFELVSSTRFPRGACAQVLRPTRQ